MDIPDEIVVDILRRVPVKSLVRFRCVSKSWRSLISDPTFVRTHLISFGTDSRILFSGYGNTLSFLQHHENDDGGGFAVAEELELDLDLVKDLNGYVRVKVKVKGHCDGLLCLAIEDDEKALLVVYNPSIREHRILPLPPNFFGTIGIGYDPSIDDYKIVRVPSTRFRFNLFKFPAGVEIFTLKSKSNSWRSLPHQDTPPYPIHQNFQTTNANGGLYWLCVDNDVSRDVILRFDLVEEKFRVVEFHWSITWLGSLRDSLRVIHSQADTDTHMHLWSTKDDQTWTKLITLLPTLNPSVYKPFCYTKTGALLLIKVRGKEFVMFEPGENRFRQLPVRGVEHQYHLHKTVYRESLVSPNCGIHDDED